MLELATARAHAYAGAQARRRAGAQGQELPFNTSRGRMPVMLKSPPPPHSVTRAYACRRSSLAYPRPCCTILRHCGTSACAHGALPPRLSPPSSASSERGGDGSGEAGGSESASRSPAPSEELLARELPAERGGGGASPRNRRPASVPPRPRRALGIPPLQNGANWFFFVSAAGNTLMT